MRTRQNLSLRQCIALKIMPDIRFFDAGDGDQPVLAVTGELAQGLAALEPCGVILFRENLASVAQSQALTRQIRECLGDEALIGIDQEGGRVTRLPRDATTSFSGNMALAACPDVQRQQLAAEVGAAQAQELLALGINTNFVPSLDVNSNPQNPVIGVRSFGDNPQAVAELGAALVRGMQSQGAAAAVKHFPGHGDTSQDSHTDLPCVDRSREEAMAIDLAPFRAVITDAAPAMVMTAHIQYPSLDDSCLPGTNMVRPATLSRAMMTDLLRDEMAYQGVIITDAMDMQAISERLTPTDAVIACFSAGVDIALMPVLIRSPASFEQLNEIVAAAVAAVHEGQLDEAEIRASAQRILGLQDSLSEARPTAAAETQVGAARHLELEQTIAEHCMTLVSGSLAPIQSGTRVHLLMPGEQTAEAMRKALLAQMPELQVTSQNLENFDAVRERQLVDEADFYFVGVSEPAISAVALGGAEDLPNLPDHSPASVQKALLSEATAVTRVVAMLNSPYRAPEFAPLADAVLATYDGAPIGFGGAPGPAFQALAKVLCGQIECQGRLPVSLPA
jgi:beta-N-acetylhexosaminidase